MNYYSPPRLALPQSLGSAEILCWSRMQTEAGQPLHAIVARKEKERAAGGGLFLWGVGNAPAVATSALARLSRPIPVVFSIMKTKAKAIDVAPARTVIWRRYIDSSGVERPLPLTALVTSRGDSPTRAKKAHYALMCCSNEPLALEYGTPFDHRAYRNAGAAGAPVGASQVTALLKRSRPTSENADYEVNLRAWLSESYWVRLTDPLELNARKILQLSSTEGIAPSDWPDFVAELRRGERVPAVQDLLL